MTHSEVNQRLIGRHALRMSTKLDHFGRLRQVSYQNLFFDYGQLRIVRCAKRTSFLHRELKSLTDGIKILCRTKVLALEPSGAPLGYD